MTLKYIELKSSSSDHPSKATQQVVHVPNMQTEPVVATTALEAGSAAGKVAVHELATLRTADGSSAEKLTAQEDCDSISKLIQDSELEKASGSAEPMVTCTQDKEESSKEQQLEKKGNLKTRSVVGEQTKSDAQKQGSAGESTTETGAAVTEKSDDVTGQMEDTAERDKHSRDSSLERVS